MGWNRKEGRGNKDFIKRGGGQAGSRDGCLKKGWGWNPLTPMVVRLTVRCQTFAECASAIHTRIYIESQILIEVEK